MMKSKSQDMQTNIKKFLHFFLPNIRMSGKTINFDDKKISKSNFYRNKELFNIDGIDANKILVSKREPYGKKSSFKFLYWI